MAGGGRGGAHAPDFRTVHEVGHHVGAEAASGRRPERGCRPVVPLPIPWGLSLPLHEFCGGRAPAGPVQVRPQELSAHLRHGDDVRRGAGSPAQAQAAGAAGGRAACGLCQLQPHGETGEKTWFHHGHRQGCAAGPAEVAERDAQGPRQLDTRPRLLASRAQRVRDPVHHEPPRAGAHGLRAPQGGAQPERPLVEDLHDHARGHQAGMQQPLCALQRLQAMERLRGQGRGAARSHGQRVAPLPRLQP
mmetsp:Transcript_37557/g.104453  ORF Transcript_37557/g.104453 Transcript_37557/m.104453 type:complete len:247 (-) Transcript_37557:510-1250(-)